MSQEFSVAVVGATGAVGQQIVKLLEDRNFPTRTLRLLLTRGQNDSGRVVKIAASES